MFTSFKTSEQTSWLRWFRVRRSPWRGGAELHSLGCPFWRDHSAIAQFTPDFPENAPCLTADFLTFVGVKGSGGWVVFTLSTEQDEGCGGGG